MVGRRGPDDYEPETYWEGLHRRGDLSAVGQSGAPVSFNRWLYATFSRRLTRFADLHGLRPSTVFEAGAGTGYWVEWWQRRGAQVDGCDLVPLAVERLEEKFGGRFVTLDIAEDSPTSTYELVHVFSVLLHITDDRRFERALANLAAAVAPGGHLLLLEPLQMPGRYWASYSPTASSRARDRQEYVQPLLRSGLAVVTIEPGTALAADPIEARSRLCYLGWLGTWRAMKTLPRVWPPLGGVTGRLIHALDPIVLRSGAAPAVKLCLFRRPDEVA